MLRIENTCRQEGFAYLWILFSVALLSVGLALVLEMDETATRREQEKELLAIGHQFREAIERYYAELTPAGSHEYPEQLDDLLLDKRNSLSKRHLRKVFVDPLTGKANWGLVRMENRIVGIFSFSKFKPIKQDGFAPEDAAFKGKSSYQEWIFSCSSSLP